MRNIVFASILFLPLFSIAQSWNYSNTDSRYPIIGEFNYSGGNDYQGNGVLPHFRIRNTSGPAIVNQFWAKDSNGDLKWFNISYNAENKLFAFSGQQQGASIYFNHNVGIGTSTTGSHKLAVEGSIGAREIKVEVGPGWSDFVFENDYELRTLEEVENYIAENKHLPEIPSEAEVTENGINLGEMDAKLLQKIEELTLYLIEQNKEIRELKKLTQRQQADIERLKSE